MYRIGEISKLYNISTDILRHYEKIGLLSPEKREGNGYRYYSNKQIWKLGTIRALRMLGIGLDEISGYLKKRSIEKTKDLVDFQLGVIESKLEDLEDLKEQLRDKKEYLGKMDKEIQYGRIEKRYIEDRRCFKRHKSVVTDWEMDLELKKLKKKSKTSESEHFAASKVGALVDLDGYKHSLYNIYQGTFLIHSQGESRLKAGEYLVLNYRGPYRLCDKYYTKIKEYIEKNRLEVDGEILEIYKIDIFETDDEEEFITEIQVPIKIK